MPNYKLWIAAFVTIMFGYLAFADQYSNVAVGFEQGGSQLSVKTGGQIKVRDTSMFQLSIPIEDIGTVSTSAAGRNFAIAPFAGTISLIKCAGSTTMPGATATKIGTNINGAHMLSGLVTMSSTAAAYTAASATPTADNTVVAGDVITVGSDGATTSTPGGACQIFITP